LIDPVLSQHFPGGIEENDGEHEIIQEFIQRFRLNPKFLLVLASTIILGSDSHGSHDNILFSDGSGSFQAQFSHPYFGRDSNPPPAEYEQRISTFR
jgi:hypothetical protein